MKLPVGFKKWGVPVFALAIVLLVVNLVAQYRDLQPGKGHVAAATSRRAPVAGKVYSHAADDLAKYDPTVRFDQLKALDSRPLPDADRNPYEPLGWGPDADH